MSNIVLNEEQKQILEKAVKEMVSSFYRMQAEKDLQKEICKEIKEKIEMQPKIFRKLSKTAYLDDAKKLNEEVTEILDLAEELGFYSHDEGC